MNYSINDYSLEQIGREGSGRITAKIQGYWSTDPITFYINRRGWKPADVEWKLTLSHSSGGRDSKEVESDMEAAINFADAMRALAQLGQELMSSSYIDKLEAFYQDERIKLNAKFEAEKAALNAAIDADTAIGEVAATGIVAEMIAFVATKCITQRKFYRRGKPSIVQVQAEKYTHTRFKMNGATISKKDLIAEIATLSMRNVETAA